jgi:hypothetical protein
MRPLYILRPRIYKLTGRTKREVLHLENKLVISLWNIMLTRIGNSCLNENIS